MSYFPSLFESNAMNNISAYSFLSLFFSSAKENNLKIKFYYFIAAPTIRNSSNWFTKYQYPFFQNRSIS